MGPVEILVVSFPGNKFKGEIIPALDDLVDKSTIRIIDMVFVNKDNDGAVDALELSDIDAGTAKAVSPITNEISGLLSPEDIDQVGAALDNNSSAAMLLFENVWATRLRDAIRGAGGQIVALERIPADAVELALTAQAAS